MTPDDLITKYDHPAVNARVFFPRPDFGFQQPAGSRDEQVQVGDGDIVAVRYHLAEPDLPAVLYFHGNGEIVADYDDLAPVFRSAGASLVCADYRGYGKSTGQPSMGRLVRDAHQVLDSVLGVLGSAGHRGPVVVMGRSLGSAPAIELASDRGGEVAGLIVESGFAQVGALLELLGVDLHGIGLGNLQGQDNEDKMARVAAPVLLLHAEQDMIIPLWHAQHNHDRAAAQEKRLVVIPHADHNSIMTVGGHRYWGAIADFLRQFSN